MVGWVLGADGGNHKKMFKEHHQLTFDELRTVVVEIEGTNQQSPFDLYIPHLRGNSKALLGVYYAYFPDWEQQRVNFSDQHFPYLAPQNYFKKFNI